MMRRLFVMAILATMLALLSINVTEAQSTNSYTCEFAGFAEVEDGTLVDLQVTTLECK